MKTPQIFIAYASADLTHAKRLFFDLGRIGATPWLDKECIVAGENWKNSIWNAIENSDFFVPLLSSNSVNRRGYFQKELKLAFEVLDEIPPPTIFILPARIEPCEITHPHLQSLQWVDMFPSWDRGLSDIAKAIDLKFLRGDKVSVAVESVHSGKLVEFQESPNVSISFLTEKCRKALDLRREVNTGALEGFWIRWVLVDVQAEDHWKRLSRSEKRSLRALVKGKGGLKFSYSKSDKLSDLDLFDGTKFHLYPIEDEEREPGDAALVAEASESSIDLVEMRAICVRVLNSLKIDSSKLSVTRDTQSNRESCLIAFSHEGRWVAFSLEPLNARSNPWEFELTVMNAVFHAISNR